MWHKDTADSFDPRSGTSRTGIGGWTVTDRYTSDWQTGGWAIGPSRERIAVDIGHSRLIVAAILFLIGFALVAGRLVEVALMQPGEPTRYASRGDDLHGTRSDIIDRNGLILATTLPSPSLFANPLEVSDPADTARKLAALLPDLKVEAIHRRLSQDRYFVWIRRHLTPDQKYAVNRLGIPGLYFQNEERRFYPHGSLTAHLVGFTDIDNRGLAGVERFSEKRLRSNSQPLALSIDLRLQHLVRQELQAAMTRFQGIGAAGVIMDVDTGELVAMVSLPAFDPYRPAAAAESARFNRATLGVYELGSTFKIFNTAMALDMGVADMDDFFDATHPIYIGRFSIRDYHAKRRWLSVPEIFQYSSNIGSAKMAIAVGSDKQQAFFQKLGFLAPLRLELTARGRPQYPSRWRDVHTMTIAYGHGISITPVHLVSGVASMVNGGELRRPTLLRRSPEDARDRGRYSRESRRGKDFDDTGFRRPASASGRQPEDPRIISAATSENIRKLMRLVVTNGTGRNADAPGFWVGGKTGTAEKSGGHRGYHRKSLISSFVAAFPIQQPRYVVFAMIDEPQGTKETGGFATGGWVAAPVVKNLITRMAPMVGIVPTPEDDPDITRRLYVDVPTRKEKYLAAN